jgi:3-hydroxyacyl-CoA dehydrogenase / enoyl-CoA hydratase / 3-hydroxybutyryl-CoA epimerase
MNPESNARIPVGRPLDATVVDRIEAALSDQAIDVLSIEFQSCPETENFDIEQIRDDEKLIDRLRKLLRTMEQGPKAAVALISETMGGLQLEIALACHARFANVETVYLDLPWLKYGLMPVLGTTQRLPRLCGIESAANLLFRTEKTGLSAEAAAGLLVVTKENLSQAAMTWVDANPKRSQPWDRIPQELSETYSQRPLNRQLFEKIYLKVRNRFTPEESAPKAILRCLQDGLERSIDAGIRLEAERWSVVRRSASTLNRLKTLHLTRQKARKRATDPRASIARIGVLGAGLMGTGIAYTAARAGYEVLVVDVSPEASDRSLQRMKKTAQQDADSGLLKRERPSDLLNRVRWAPDLAAFARCDFIVEAIFERADLKKAKLAEVAAVADPAATIASNTTTLPISDLALACGRPERFLGTHFFAPVDRMELLEIVVGEKTSQETVDRALVLANALGKTPIIVRDGPGFFTSRVVAAYLQEALFMVREGISPWMIDNVARNAGMVLGPLTMADLMSLELLLDIFESLARHQRGAAKDAGESVKILRSFTNRSRLGKKSGAGIYDYGSGNERIDPAGSHALFAAATHEPAPEEIEERLFIIQTIEALHAMREGIIDDVAMADLASVLGWSYPASRGGVMAYRDQIGKDQFERTRARLQEKFGNRFALPEPGLTTNL